MATKEELREAMVRQRRADGASRFWETSSLAVVSAAIALAGFGLSNGQTWMVIPAGAVVILGGVGGMRREKYARAAVEADLRVEELRAALGDDDAKA